MKKIYDVTVKFNLTNEVKKTIEMDFDIEKLSSDNTMIFVYTGNSKSSEQSAINGIKNRLNMHKSFKENFTFENAKER